MASKRRMRRRQCEGKRRFPDPETARSAALSAWRACNQRFNVYRCDFCGGYHFGHAMHGKVRRKNLHDKFGWV
jgi:hypothetical protein